MNIYESTLIIKPQLSDGDTAALIEEVKKFITKDGGEILVDEKLGRRKLAHEIKHERDGFYSYLKFKASADIPAKFNEFCRINEHIMRALTVRSIEKEIKPSVKPPVSRN